MPPLRFNEDGLDEEEEEPERLGLVSDELLEAEEGTATGCADCNAGGEADTGKNAVPGLAVAAALGCPIVGDGEAG